MAYWTIEPPIADRIEISVGILASVVANGNRDPKRRPEPFRPQDFIVQWHETQQRDSMSPEVIRAKMFAAFGPRVKRKEGREVEASDGAATGKEVG